MSQEDELAPQEGQEGPLCSSRQAAQTPLSRAPRREDGGKHQATERASSVPKNTKRSSASLGTADLDVCLVPGPTQRSCTAGAREAHQRLKPGSSAGGGQEREDIFQVELTWRGRCQWGTDVWQDGTVLNEIGQTRGRAALGVEPAFVNQVGGRWH